MSESRLKEEQALVNERTQRYSRRGLEEFMSRLRAGAGDGTALERDPSEEVEDNCCHSAVERYRFSKQVEAIKALEAVKKADARFLVGPLSRSCALEVVAFFKEHLAAAASQRRTSGRSSEALVPAGS